MSDDIARYNKERWEISNDMYQSFRARRLGKMVGQRLRVAGRLYRRGRDGG